MSLAQLLQQWHRYHNARLIVPHFQLHTMQEISMCSSGGACHLMSFLYDQIIVYNSFSTNAMHSLTANRFLQSFLRTLHHSICHKICISGCNWCISGNCAVGRLGWQTERFSTCTLQNQRHCRLEAGLRVRYVPRQFPGDCLLSFVSLAWRLFQKHHCNYVSSVHWTVFHSNGGIGRDKTVYDRALPP